MVCILVNSIVSALNFLSVVVVWWWYRLLSLFLGEMLRNLGGKGHATCNVLHMLYMYLYIYLALFICIDIWV